MRGTHRVRISAKHIRYEFELRRNITIIRGDSATGKTTLVDMVRVKVNDPAGSPVDLVCDKTCFVLEGVLWKEQLSAVKDSIVFIDEGNAFVKSKEFAAEIQKTDNYYVIITRESLPMLPYSVEEVYGIRTSGKYGTLKQSYHEFYRIYGRDRANFIIEPEMILTEDSNSGYQFFRAVSMEKGLECETARGKSNVFHVLNKQKRKNILVIADGAAFGPEMDRVLQLIKRYPNLNLYLPESFEWLILSSDILKDKKIKEILNNPSEQIECREYFSWERFFTTLLTVKTENTYLCYAKKELNQAYLNENVKSLILGQMKKIRFHEQGKEGTKEK